MLSLSSLSATLLLTTFASFALPHRVADQAAPPAAAVGPTTALELEIATSALPSLLAPQGLARATLHDARDLGALRAGIRFRLPYVVSRRLLGMAWPHLRVFLPFGPFARLIYGGVGVCAAPRSHRLRLALRGPGGLTMQFGRTFAIGAEVTYEPWGHGVVERLSIGPAIAFGG